MSNINSFMSFLLLVADSCGMHSQLEKAIKDFKVIDVENVADILLFLGIKKAMIN